MRRSLAGWIVGLVLGTGVAALAQGTISDQVLQLLSRNNTWTGTNVYANTVGVTLQSGGFPPSLTANTLYNLGGALYFNGVLVATSAGAGTVTSVGLTVPSFLSVAGSPVTTAGTLAVTLATQSANMVFAGPSAGIAAAPTFRALVAADIPPISSGSISGIIPVANGGTGLASGTSGGVLAYSATGTIVSSGALVASRLVLGGGAGAAPTVLGSLGTTSTVLHGNAAGAPTWGAVALATDVSGTLPVTNGGLGIATGTSGGIPYFSAATTIASSAVLTANRLVLGGGAGVAPTVLASLGTTSTVLHGNAAGVPTFGAVVLTVDVSGTLPVANGGIGVATLTGIPIASGTSAFTAATSSTVGQVLRVTGANTFAWGAVNLADTDAITGSLPEGNGGTGVDASAATNGQLLIGDGTGLTLATVTGTTDQIVVTNGAGSITLATPQGIGTTSTPQFARLGLGTGAGGTAVLTTTGLLNLGRFDNSTCGAADTITWTAGMIQFSTLSAAVCVYTFSAPTVSGATFTLEVIQDAGGGRLVTWPGSVTWDGGVAPTLSTAPNAVDVCRFYYTGSIYLGSCLIGS